MRVGTEPSNLMDSADRIINSDDLILLTGATGFIGTKVLDALRRHGFRRLRCLVRTSSTVATLESVIKNGDCGLEVELVKGNLLSREDCEKVTEGVSVIYHLAAGTGTKSFADAFANSVVTTRNLLEGALRHEGLRRFVNVSSFAVYTNEKQPRAGILNEDCPTETHPASRGDSYCFAKTKQDELVINYGKKQGLPYVLVRPGVVYGPGKYRIHGRVGLDTFGIFLHLGGSNQIPLTFVDNCADAIALAGLTKGIDGEVFNVVDDDLPSSRQFLKMYKKEVTHFPSFYLPHFVSYLLCFLWEKYSGWSQGQLPPVHNRKEWVAFWKRTSYSNEKIKKLLGWAPRVSTAEGLRRYFDSCKKMRASA
jgi:nucleoside-diphosphate-sugar epimerase